MKKITKEQANDLDVILKTLISKQSNQADSVEKINENLLPDKSKVYCSYLFYILADFSPRLLYPEDNLSERGFWATDDVAIFLYEGGFKAIYEKQKAEAEKEALLSEKSKYDVKNAKRIFNTYWWTFGMSILGIFLSLVKIIYDVIM